MAHAPDLAALMQRAQRACDDLATLREEVAHTRAETRRVMAIARQARLADGWIVPDATMRYSEPTALYRHLRAHQQFRLGTPERAIRWVAASGLVTVA